MVETVMVDLALVHNVRSLDLVTMFVLASSRSKPFGAPVTGSWSKRGVFTGTISMRPWELTNVPMDSRVNVGTGIVTGVGAMIDIVRSMAAVVAR